MLDNLLQRSGARWNLRALVLIAALLMTACASGAGQGASTDKADFSTVSTTSGSLRGKVSGDDAVEVFKGIPYAAPPVGELRWSAPRPPVAWSGTRDAFEAGSPCPQTGRLASTNEDCLHLNVWTPHRRPEHKLPVMVFLHGGGQRQSAANEYNADWLVTRGIPVVYVSMNYRMNVFAFFAHKGLTAEDPDLGSGNYALLDQLQALRWVRGNIASFGGDPENVTIFGESGGAQAVCLLLASPPAAGFFHRAISQSGPCQWQLYPSLTASEERGAQVATELGCTEPTPLPCLRALPADVVLAKEQGATSNTAGGQPAWGGGAVPLPMREAMATGRFAKVPLMQGGNRDEALYQLAEKFGGQPNSVTAEQYPEVLGQYFGPSRVAAIQERYPLSSYPSPMHALSAALTDSGMITNNRIGLCNLNLANQLAAPHVPLYAFEFADPTAPYPAPIFEAEGNLAGAAHTKELSYLFHQSELTPAQREISDMMIQYWTNFAATGDPNGTGLPVWPVYKPDEQMVTTFGADDVSADANLYSRSNCKFWAEQGFSSLSGPYPTSTASGPEYK